MVLNLKISDFNRLRWTIFALETNLQLRTSFRPKEKYIYITDNIILLNTPANVNYGSYVILWDGYNSYLELATVRHDLSNRKDLNYLYIGAFKEIEDAMPSGSMPLFTRSKLIDFNCVNTPASFKFKCALKTRLRKFRNYLLDIKRHKILSTQRNIVFCGLISPSKKVLERFLIGSNLATTDQVFCQLVDVKWSDPYDTVKQIIISIYEKCGQSVTRQPIDMAASYTILNLCHRLLVLSFLNSLQRNIFVSEYGVNPHIDPYDSSAYQQNFYLDFGSSRGACLWYPRTADMIATKKEFIHFRFLPQTDSLFSYILKTTAEEFVSKRETEVLELLKEIDI